MELSGGGRDSDDSPKSCFAAPKQVILHPFGSILVLLLVSVDRLVFSFVIVLIVVVALGKFVVEAWKA